MGSLAVEQSRTGVAGGGAPDRPGGPPAGQPGEQRLGGRPGDLAAHPRGGEGPREDALEAEALELRRSS